MSGFRVVFITCSTVEEANRIGSDLIKERLAACVNVVKGIASIFWWRGKVDRAEETLLIIKTRKEKIKDVIELVKKLHSYQVPEVISLPIVEGNEEYLNWISEATSQLSGQDSDKLAK